MKIIKGLFIATTFLMVLWTTSAFTSPKNGKVIIIVSIEVKDFSVWKKGFDAGAPVREKAGIKVISICASTENPNHVVVIEEAENAQAAQDFLALLKSKQKEGDMSALDVKIYDKVE